MAEYESSLTVSAAPDAVFAFISDVSNLPKYLPTTHSAQAQGTDRVRVQGEAEGHKYDADGYFRAADAGQRLEWGSDGEHNYRGWMDIGADGTGGGSRVTVHLSFDPSEVMQGQEQKGRDAKINESLRAALESIKNHVEGDGGKVEPSAAT